MNQELKDAIRDIMREELQPIKEQLNRIEANQNDDVIGLLKIVSSKIDALTEGQDRHERMLELLSKRSIEQEAEIRDLRRR